jgi:hypothetical protein
MSNRAVRDTITDRNVKPPGWDGEGATAKQTSLFAVKVATIIPKDRHARKEKKGF